MQKVSISIFLGMILITHICFLYSNAIALDAPTKILENQRGIKVVQRGIITGLIGEGGVLLSPKTSEEKQVLQFKQSISPGESIVTNPNGTVEILFHNSVLVRIVEKSQVNFTQSGDNSLAINLLYGKVELAVSNKEEKETQNYQLKTPTLVTSIKQGLLNATVDQSKELETVNVFEGIVDLKNSRSSQVTQGIPYSRTSKYAIKASFNNFVKSEGNKSRAVSLRAGQGFSVRNGNSKGPFSISTEESSSMRSQYLAAYKEHQKTPGVIKEQLTNNHLQNALLLSRALVGAAEDDQPETEFKEEVILATTGLAGLGNSSTDTGTFDNILGNLPDFGRDSLNGPGGVDVDVNGNCSGGIGAGCGDTPTAVFSIINDPGSGSPCQAGSVCAISFRLAPTQTTPINDTPIAFDNESISKNEADVIAILDFNCNSCSGIPATFTTPPNPVNTQLIHLVNNSSIGGVDHAIRLQNISTINEGTEIDTALLEATGPLIALFSGSQIDTSGDFISLETPAGVLTASNLAPGDSLLQLDSSHISTDGNLFNIANGGRLNINGTLASLQNTSTLNINGGVLVRVGTNSTFNIAGHLLAFGPGTNTATISGTGCPGCTRVDNIPNLQGLPILLGPGVAVTGSSITGAAVTVDSGFQPFLGLETINNGTITTQVEEFSNATNVVNISSETGVLEIHEGATVNLLAPGSSLP